MIKTKEQFFDIIDTCETIFNDKAILYGASWRVFRLGSIIDQIFIKIKRIRQLEITKDNQVGEDKKDPYIAMINYSIIGLIQLELPVISKSDLSTSITMKLYKKYYVNAWNLLEKKNHDYGEAWRDMYIESFTDLILVKINRLKQIFESNEKNDAPIIDAYYDIINYSIFALIKINK